jgi:RNA polymerase sigma factor (sigma-70 family)
MTVVRSGARAATPEETFRGMFARHYGAVFGYCARRLGRDDAADATADVFAVAWRRIRRVPAEPMALPWLYGVARNTVANARRSAARRARLDARIGDHAQYVWTDSSAATEMDAVLERLSDDDREVLMLVAWEGLGPADLGRVLGVSPSAAAVRLHRARSRLSDVWNDSGGAR